MKLDINQDLRNKLNNAATYWNQHYHNPNLDAEIPERYFDHWCKETYGLNVTLVQNTTNYGHSWLSWDTAEVIDDEKYTWFLLSF